MLDKRTAINTAKQYSDVIIKELSPTAVVMFGSYYNGVPHKDSDIDIGIIFDGFTGDWLNTSTRLWDLAYDISFDIEPHLLDIADDKSGFARYVYNTGQIIYKGEKV